MPPPIDMTGEQIGLWTVLRLADDSSPARRKWICLCDPARGGCGVEKSVHLTMLRNGRSNGCDACARKPRWAKTCQSCGSLYTGVYGSRYCSPRCRKHPKARDPDFAWLWVAPLADWLRSRGHGSAAADLTAEAARRKPLTPPRPSSTPVTGVPD